MWRIVKLCRLVTSLGVKKWEVRWASVVCDRRLQDWCERNWSWCLEIHVLSQHMDSFRKDLWNFIKKCNELFYQKQSRNTRVAWKVCAKMRRTLFFCRNLLFSTTIYIQQHVVIGESQIGRVRLNKFECHQFYASNTRGMRLCVATLKYMEQS